MLDDEYFSCLLNPAMAFLPPFYTTLILCLSSVPSRDNGTETAPLCPSQAGNQAKVKRKDPRGLGLRKQEEKCFYFCLPFHHRYFYSWLLSNAQPIQPSKMESKGTSRGLRARRASGTLVPGRPTGNTEGFSGLFLPKCLLGYPFAPGSWLREWAISRERHGSGSRQLGKQVWRWATFSLEKHSEKLFSGCWRPPPWKTPQRPWEKWPLDGTVCFPKFPSAKLSRPWWSNLVVSSN